MPDTTPPPDILSLDTIKAAVRSRAEEAGKTLAALRLERVKLNHRIKAALAEEKEARRLANALKPATRKPKTNPKGATS